MNKHKVLELITSLAAAKELTHEEVSQAYYAGLSSRFAAAPVTNMHTGVITSIKSPSHKRSHKLLIALCVLIGFLLIVLKVMFFS
jgi:hypothetical protein